MRNTSLRSLAFALCAVLMATRIFANSSTPFEGHVQVPIKASQVQGAPKTNSIQASINGHFLAVVFTENLGQVSVEVATTAGASVQCLSVLTPNGLQVYIPNAGDYIITFTLSNGDVYYGEFEVM